MYACRRLAFFCSENVRWFGKEIWREREIRKGHKWEEMCVYGPGIIHKITHTVQIQLSFV